MSTAHSIDVVTPGDRDALVITPGPCRARLTNGVIVEGPPAKEVRCVGGAVVFLWEHAPGAGCAIRARLEYADAMEASAPPRARWERFIDLANLESLSRRVPEPHEWGPLYAARKDLASREAGQAFLFELDRRTQHHLLVHTEDIETEERAYAEWAAGTTVRALDARLRARIAHKHVPPLADRPAAAYLSSIVRSAALALGPAPWEQAGAVLCDFASGWMVREVPIPPGGPQNTFEVGDPNGYFLYFFAEFAMGAIDHGIDRDMWEALLAYTVWMQPCFRKRFYIAHCVLDFGMPPKRLTLDERREIDARYRSRAFSRNELLGLIDENVRSACAP